MNRFDLIVTGGGFSGVAAAVAAARQGLSVLLIEKNGALGGAATNSIVNPFMGYSTKTEGGEELFLSRGIFEEIVSLLNECGALRGNTFHEEYLKLILDRLVVEVGVEVLFHSSLCGVNHDKGVLKSISVAGKAGVQNYEASYFIDASGDADLAAMCGCAFRLGRPGDNFCQPMTLCFRVGNVDIEKYSQNKPMINELYQKLQSEGKIKNPRENVLVFRTMVDNVLHFNRTRGIKHNPTDPKELSRAEMLAREQMFELFSFLKDNIPGFENSDLLFSGAEIGVRESRMIDGEYILTEEDIKACTKFEDAIAACNYDIDIHNPSGSGTSHYYFAPGAYYTIPYRSLVCREIKNLLVAGRCISATHEAQASLRIMPVCCCLGEAAGIAAGVANRKDSIFKEADIPAIQSELKRVGAFIGI